MEEEMERSEKAAYVADVGFSSLARDYGLGPDELYEWLRGWALAWMQTHARPDWCLTLRYDPDVEDLWQEAFIHLVQRRKKAAQSDDPIIYFRYVLTCLSKQLLRQRTSKSVKGRQVALYSLDMDPSYLVHRTVTSVADEFESPLMSSIWGRLGSPARSLVIDLLENDGSSRAVIRKYPKRRAEIRRLYRQVKDAAVVCSA